MNRHYWTCFVISAAVPIIGAALAWALGMKWEQWTHGGSIPNDPDTRADLANNKAGIRDGTILGLAMWAYALAKLL